MPLRKELSRRRFIQGAATLSAASALEELPTAAAVTDQSHGTDEPQATERPLRYRPEGKDFVIEKGRESFNRPLYSGRHSAFRIDAGDRPEFSLYVPGRGGVLRLGVRTAEGAVRWLFDLETVETRYRPGSMVYTVRDPALLQKSSLTITALPMNDAEGLVLCAELRGSQEPVELVWAYGGADGVRGSRGGDIGAEREPVSQFFRLTPERCKGSLWTLENSSATLESKAGIIRCVMPVGAKAALGYAADWDNPVRLLASSAGDSEAPVLVGRVVLRADAPIYLCLQLLADRKRDGTLNPVRISLLLQDLPRAFEGAERRRQAAVARLDVNTPDPFINAAAAALCVAGDGIWDDTAGVYMHGAVAWRSPLAGWRGQYTGNAQGQHDRTRRHLRRFASQQNTMPIPAQMPGPDARSNLSRSEDALHSNGNLTSNHYDMNLVCVDSLFRYLLWTGDLAFAREMWPMLMRHHAWERRLFRRAFGADKLPLYEAYACIWASDDLQYHGGGVTHASAYNCWHNHMTARVARLLDEDPAAFEEEAQAVQTAMRRELWLADRGWYAEWKDLLGLRSVHPDAALWTFYHLMDSDAVTPVEAWQLARYVETRLPHIPVQGPGVPREDLYTLPTTRWMPYTWSTNNVVMAESAHSALAFWQAGRPDSAFALWKGCILDSMFLGLCPGNAGMTTFFDHARGEAQRDFADAVGTNSRALVEGLFGVRPDALAGELMISPSFPKDWKYARLRHLNVLFSFRRSGPVDIYEVESRFPHPMALKIVLSAQRDRIKSVIINGVPSAWQVLPESVGEPKIAVSIPSSVGPVKVTINWEGALLETIRHNEKVVPVIALGSELKINLRKAQIESIADPQKALGDLQVSNHLLRAKAVGVQGHRTVFAQVRQGEMVWWLPIPFEIRPAFEIVPGADDISSFRLRNNTLVRFNSPVIVHLGGQYSSIWLCAPGVGLSDICRLPAEGPLPGSQPVAVEVGGAILAKGVVTDWTRRASIDTNWEIVSLAPVFNDQVTKLFQNEYLSPRSPYCSLAIPKQGIGSWCHPDATFEIDDSGLRGLSERTNGKIVLPQGIPFSTPGMGNSLNIAFVSQWDNYPDTLIVPLDGRAAHLYLLLAGTTNSMQSRFDNGEVLVTYNDGSEARLALHNPTTWWPIDQDYYIDSFAFRRPEPIPPRLDLKTGAVRVAAAGQTTWPGGRIPGGAATILDLPLDTGRELRTLEIRALANEVVVGLMAATLVRLPRR